MQPCERLWRMPSGDILWLRSSNAVLTTSQAMLLMLCASLSAQATRITLGHKPVRNAHHANRKPMHNTHHTEHKPTPIKYRAQTHISCQRTFSQAHHLLASIVAFMRRTPAEEDSSFWMWKCTRSPVLEACGPPQISLENSPMVYTLTRSPYLLSNRPMAP